MNSSPSVLHIEPTNACNYTCAMCLRSTWSDASIHHIPVGLFSALARENSSSLKRLVLYGWGEPLLHPGFVELLRTARKWLPGNATIHVTTNGSLLSPSLTKCLVGEHLVDEIIFSCDSLSSLSDSVPGHSLSSGPTGEHLRYLLDLRDPETLKIGVQTTIMRSTFRVLPDLVERLSRLGIDHITASHVYPYFSSMAVEMVYTLMSTEALSILQGLGDKGWDFMQKHKHKTLTTAHLEASDRDAGANEYLRVLEQAKKEDIKLNFTMYRQLRRELGLLREVEHVLNTAGETGRRAGIDMELPPVFAGLKERRCPYVENSAACIRSDGEVAPCFKFLYPHKSFLGLHSRSFSAHSFGNVGTDALAAIWQSSAYRSFRENLRDMNAHIAWCGDCSFAANNCYFITEDTGDCLMNEPFCAECPYSLNLTRCML